MKHYDLIVYFDADYLCTGSFYDSFEYFHRIHELAPKPMPGAVVEAWGVKRHSVAFVANVKEGKGAVLKAINDKYNIWWPDFVDDFYVFNQGSQWIGLTCDTLFAPSMAAACRLYNNNVDLKFKKKLVTIMELPIEHSWMKPFRRPVLNHETIILYDNRIFTPLDHWKTAIYHRTLNFDIMKPASLPDEKVGMLNMVTDHKCYEPDEIYDIIAEYPEIKEWILFTKDIHWMKYKDMDMNVMLTPCWDYMKLFSHVLYLPSKRKFDPSPRLLPEAKWHGKEIIYHNLSTAPRDGAYFRYLDIINTWSKLKMTDHDPILTFL